MILGTPLIISNDTDSFALYFPRFHCSCVNLDADEAEDMDWTCDSCPKVSKIPGKVKKKGKQSLHIIMQSEIQSVRMQEPLRYINHMLLLGRYLIDQRNERTESMACRHIVTDRMSRGSLFSICNTQYCFVIKQNALNAVFVHTRQQCYPPFTILLFISYYLPCVPYASTRWSSVARDLNARSNEYQKRPFTSCVLQPRVSSKPGISHRRYHAAYHGNKHHAVCNGNLVLAMPCLLLIHLCNMANYLFYFSLRFDFIIHSFTFDHSGASLTNLITN